jgi:bifunctional DNase/RNase
VHIFYKVLPNYHTLKITGITPSSVGANSYILILQSIESPNLSFPIVIGSQEAQSISIFLEGISVSRPLTHDLIVNIFDSSKIDLEYIEITAFKDGIFYAAIHLLHHFEQMTIDARPSDALAVAIRLQKEIRINRNILTSICIDSDNLTEENSLDIEEQTDAESVSVGELEIQLNEALLNENYEKAAYLRDLIEKMNAENEK